MNPQLILIKSIAALYLRNKCEEVHDDTIEMVSMVAEKFTGKAGSNVDSEESNVIEGLVATIDSLVATTTGLSALDIKQTLKIQTRGELDINDFVGPYLIESEFEEDYRKLYIVLVNELRGYTRDSKLKLEMYGLKRELDFDVKPGGVGAWLEKASEVIGTYRESAVSGHARGVIASVDFSDVESVRNALSLGDDLVNGRFVLKTGWQFFNDATGVEGCVRGQTYLYNALSHNGKSYIGTNLMHQISTLNAPAMMDETKKPAIVVFSTEDTMYKYFKGLFRTIEERRLGRPLTSSDPQDSEAVTRVLLAEFEMRGYTFIFKHVDSSFSRHGLFDETDNLRREGYEIHLLLVDYFEMFDRSASALREEDAIQKDFNYIKSKYRHEHTACLLPHQASTDVQYMKSDGVERLAAKMAEGGFFKGCRGLHREADFMFSINKVIGADGCTYFEFGFGKNKINDCVSEKHKYAIRKVEEWGGIWLDYNTENMTMQSIDTGMNEEMSSTVF